MTIRERLWTRAYVGLLMTICLAYCHQALLTPTVPLYIKDLGGSTLVAGLALLAFAVPSFSARPLLGFWADTRTVFVVLAGGTLLLGLMGLLHAPRLLWLVFIASSLRGVGWGAVNTAGFSILAHIAPMQRRGEAAAYYNMFFAAPNAVFPAVALWMIDMPNAGFTLVLLLAGALGLMAFALSLFIPREAIPAAHERPEERKLRLSELFDKSAVLPSTILISMTLTIPSVISFLPLYAKHIGVSGAGWFYVASGLTIVCAQLTLGRVTDRVGRGPMLVGALGLGVVALAIIIMANSLFLLVLSGVFYAAGQGLTSATTTAVAMDRANPARKGAAMATYSTAFQIGLGIGATVAGGVIDLAGFRAMYAVSIGLLCGGIALVVANWPALQGRSAGREFVPESVA
jgi:MFS family permease